MAADASRPRLALGIRARTIAAACVVVSIGLVAASIVLLVLTRRIMIRDIDQAAAARAREVGDLVRQDNLPTSVGALGHDNALVQVVDEHGRVVVGSANVEGRNAMARFPASGSRVTIHTIHGLPVEADSSDAFRVAALAVKGPRGPATVYVGTNLERVDEAVNTARRALFLGVPLLVALVGFTTRLVVGRALRPVDAIRREVADIGAHDLDRRVPEPSKDDEIGRLARTMNAMLDRLQSSADRQRRFVADASHELQSPLAASLGDLEVALADPAATDWPATAQALVQDNERMTRLVRNLLFLAQEDHEAAGPPTTPVDLDDVVTEELRRLPADARITVDSHIEPAEVHGQPDQLARVVRNLLENARRHAEQRITVRLSRADSRAVLVVADDGRGVPLEHADRIFERFARVDSSRSRDTGGAGLGLAIAREIIERHGGTIALAPTNGSGARFEVHLPLS